MGQVTPNVQLPPVNLSIGEPKHGTPAVITKALQAHFSGLSSYPATAGSPALREAIAAWLERRYGLLNLDPKRHVLPVLGSREALFSLAQVVIDRDAKLAEPPIVLSPNPFYQIYEGAALLSGAEAHYLDQDPANGFACHWDRIPVNVLKRTQLLFVCSPGNPTGRVMPLEEWKTVFELADRYGFVIASDECYSEIWHSTPPLGALQAAQQLGRSWERVISFTSLSKRSNAPGLRSGFVSGDPEILKQFLLYRTYHGSAMSLMVQAASTAAWNDEQHVLDNRAQYAAKYKASYAGLNAVLPTEMPDAGFYYWLKVPDIRTSASKLSKPNSENAQKLSSDELFVQELYRQSNVLSLPGSYLSRENNGFNPGNGYIRLALVESQQTCQLGIDRLIAFCQQTQATHA
jgi:N-succinyldiaminopimelate aminotransferase